MLALAGLTLFGTRDARAQTIPQYRGFWVDTYNTRLSSPADVSGVIARARDAGANVIFAQVRRRGDAWYLQTTTEPTPEGVAIDANFDPLQEVITQAHAAALEVHAFVVLGAVWTGTTFPLDPRHVFNTHGLTPAGPVPGRANWLTRVRPIDGAPPNPGDYRFGTDFWLDFGHPDAATYTVDIVSSLVAAYNLDGLHLDRIQYPDPAPSTPAPPVFTTMEMVATAGYNDVSLERFRRQYGLPASFVPSPGDGTWSDWRREQISSLMRRIYLSVIALKPQLKVSAGVAASGPAPADDGAWLGSEPYGRVFQDWRSWMELGLLDLAIPLNFRAEHQAANADAFAAWVAWTRGHQYGRFAAMGLGLYLNALEGTLRQARIALEPSGADALKGVVLYSMGAHNAPVTSNPFALPSQRDTPFRTFEDVAAGLRTGRTTAGQTVDNRTGNAAVFGQASSTPIMPWKAAPTMGFVFGTITGRDGAALDGATVSLESDEALGLPAGAGAMSTDGSGTFGSANLLPGSYHVIVQPVGDGRYRSGCAIEVRAGIVSTIALSAEPGHPGVAACKISTPETRR